MTRPLLTALAVLLLLAATLACYGAAVLAADWVTR